MSYNQNGRTCCYSFSDLFEAAYGRQPTHAEYNALMQVTQPERNEQVQMMADHAGWCTQERIGDDGVVYIAFWCSKDNA
jgi:hypothetical protein